MKLDQLYLNSLSRAQLKSAVKSAPHALLISGRSGTGTLTIAQALASEIMSYPVPRFILSPNDRGTISIEAIRELYVSTRTRSSEKKIVLIDTAETMSHDAQNAFLKLLEEPASQVMFILTSHNPAILLDTIVSRCQLIDIKRLGTHDSQKLLNQHHITDTNLSAQLLFLASGLPAELLRLITSDTYRSNQLRLAALAKQLVGGTRYEKIKTIAAVANLKRDETLVVIDIALRIFQSQLAKSQDDRLLDKIKALLKAEDKIMNNGHIRSQLLKTIS